MESWEGNKIQGVRKTNLVKKKKKHGIIERSKLSEKYLDYLTQYTAVSNTKENGVSFETCI